MRGERNEKWRIASENNEKWRIASERKEKWRIASEKKENWRSADVDLQTTIPGDYTRLQVVVSGSSRVTEKY